MEEIKKAVSLEAVKEQFCIQDKREALCKLRERLDEIMDPEEAAKLALEIGEEMDKAFSAEGITLDTANRIVWAVKEAYIWGCLSTAEKFMTAAEMGYSALAGEGAGA